VKLAIVHDLFLRVGGAERVLISLHGLWPDAPIYLVAGNPAVVRRHLPEADVRYSWLQRVPGIRFITPMLAPFMPAAVESWDFSDFDTVLTSSVLFAKGVVVRPDTKHLCYCFSPPRMLWDRHASYERRGILSTLARHALRMWDTASSRRPDAIAAISQTVADRIKTYWRRDALVIPPPVAVPEVDITEPIDEGYFLIVSRLMPHKNLEVAVDAFSKTRQPLVIVGDGPLRRALKRRASSNIRFVGAVSDAERDRLYARCRAVVVCNDEDFGLTPVEGMMYGKPVLALRAGGATETVVEGVTGEFFDDPAPEVLAEAIQRIRARREAYDPAGIRRHALQWSEEKFISRMRTFVEGSA
jgi:glycosyltransferase involved in cell wall biosynthesis